MSFDVFLQHFERGEPAEADRAAVAAVLHELEATGPDDSGRPPLLQGLARHRIRAKGDPT